MKPESMREGGNVRGGGVFGHASDLSSIQGIHEGRINTLLQQALDLRVNRAWSLNQCGKPGGCQKAV